MVYRTRAGALHILPAGSEARRAALGSQSPHSMRGRLLKVVMALGAAPAARWNLDADRLDHLAASIEDTARENLSIAGLYLGTPGAYRKLTITLMAADGALKAVARVPLDELSDQAVRNEAVVLKGLEAVQSLHGRIPRPLGVVSWNHRSLSVLSAGPPGRSTGTLGVHHMEFLKALHHGTKMLTPLRESGMWRRLRLEIPAIQASLPNPWPSLLERGLENLEKGLGTEEIPTSTAHRDFAPWNCRIGNDGFFVFDWEMGSERMPPLLDAIHFRAIQCAVRGRPLRLDRETSELLRQIWPAGLKVLDSLILAYLVDTGFYYAKARALRPQSGSDMVLNWFSQTLHLFLERRDR